MEQSYRLRIAANDESAAALQSVNRNLGGIKRNADEAGAALGNTLKNIKSSFGRGSEIDEFGKVLKGGGAVMGLTLMGEAADRAAKGIHEMAAGLRDPSKSTAEITEHLLEGLPVIGGMARAGHELREIFTQEQETIDAINRGTKEINEALDLQKAMAKAVLQIRRETADEEQKIVDRMHLAGLEGQKREDEERAARQSEEKRKTVEEGTKEKDKFQSEFSTKITDLKKQLSSEEQKADGVFDVGGGQLGFGSKDYYYNLDKDDPRAVAYQNAMALRRKIGTATNQFKGDVAGIDTGTRTKLGLLDRAQVAENQEVTDRRTKADRQRDEQEEFQSQQRLRQARAREREESLRALGRNASADIVALHSGADEKKAEFDNRARVEIERRASEKGIKPQDEMGMNAIRGSVLPRFQQEKFEIDQQTAAQEKTLRAKEAADATEQERRHQDEISKVRMDGLQKRLGIIKDEGGAEALSLENEHADRIAKIRERQSEELMSHRERAPAVNRQAAEDESAESGRYEAEAAGFRQRRGSLPLDFLRNDQRFRDSLGDFPAGGPSAGGSDARGNRAVSGAAAEAANQTNAKLDQLIAIMRAIHDKVPAVSQGKGYTHF